MPYYLDSNGDVQYFASIAYISELPPGSTVISDEQAMAQLPTPLNLAQQLQIGLIDDACAAAIVAGFYSNALGTQYLYPAKPTDQQNLAAAVQMSALPGTPSTWSVLFWTADRYGNWGMRGHNIAQIQQAGRDGFSWVSACIAQKVVFETAVMQSQDPVAIAKINWTPPTWSPAPAPSTQQTTTS